MARLFGKSWEREELLKHVGDIGQIADVRLSELNDGPGRGVRIAEFKTGSGLSFTVLIDRGLDIHDAVYNGIPLAYQSPVGIRHPAYYEPDGLGWLRNFHGGWLNTCGPTNVGVPGGDEFGEYGLHGRASNLPANLIGYGGKWLGDDYEIWLEASIRESSFFGFDVRLSRRFTARLGESRLKIIDNVENLGDRECPFMLLYHCNFGFPVVDDRARLVLSQKSVHPRDETAKAGLETHLVMEAPQTGFSEQVFFHELNADSNGFGTAAIVNDELNVAGFVSFRQEELPNFVQWKQVGSKEYVLGLEPANCLVFGREEERQRGTLRMLKPGEGQETVLYLGAESGVEEVADLARKIQSRESIIAW
jgi:hypothetical protein